MKMRSMLPLLLSALSALTAQDRYLQPSKNIDVCGRVELEGHIRPGGGYAPNTTGGLKGAGSDGTIHWQVGVEFFPPKGGKTLGILLYQKNRAALFLSLNSRGKLL